MKTLASLCEIAQEVARHLPGYMLAPYDPLGADSNNFDHQSCRLTRTETFSAGQVTVLTYVIQLRLIGNFTHIQVEGHWPRSNVDTNKIYPDEEQRTKILAVVCDTAPEQGKVCAAAEKIAEDIQRRFLPHYERNFKKGVEERDRDDAEERAARDFAMELANLGNCSPDPSFPSQFQGGKLSTGSFQGRVRGDRTVDFSFRDLAAPIEREIIQLVGEDAVEMGEQRDWNTSNWKIRRVTADTARKIMALFAIRPAPDYG